QKRSALPTGAREEAEKLIRLLDRKKTDGDGAETVVMAPLIPGEKSERAGAPRTDTLDLSLTGSYNLKETKLEFAVDMEYTKDTALTNAWVNSQNSMFRFLGSSGKVSDEAVVGMSKNEFSEYMKTHELDKEINWFSVDLQVWGSCDLGTFTKFTDYVGALYASLEDRIMADFAGDEQTEQLEKLNAVYAKAVNEVVENTVERTERSFSDLGVALPEGKLEESVRRVMDDKVNAYCGFIAKNEDYAGIKNTEDQWMARDIGFMAHSLTNAYQPSNAEADEELWSENDILVLGMFGSMYAGATGEGLANLQMIRANDEESLGLEISKQWLTDQKVTSTFDPNADVKSLCGKLFEQYVENLIKNADNAIKIIGKNTIGTDSSQFSPTNRSAVYAVLDIMKQGYSESGDEKTALVKTAAFVRNAFLKKAESSYLWRYNNEYGTNAKKYWEGFYDAKGGEPSAMKSILTKWERFGSVIGSKDFYKIFKEIGFGLPE
ncbi:MAG: hypothetical protein NC237_06800, partial [Eubacterium sp.]|nr:hypothetical protein [Eubacterium sp.]